ncbi:MAG: hypothetical protein ACLQIK_21095 [Mycobacterium sp.]|uniref:hypothetical protein n=2 Tax=Mycobacterium sp. TaxID=1785 RepID=UPI003F94B35D
MLTIRDHDVEDYAALRDMDATDVGMLNEDDRACLDELGQYLVSTDAFQRFAIWLLHKHFEPAAGEVFAESVITAPRGTKTTPVKRCFAQGLNATTMRFDADAGSGVGVIGMEFADPTDFGSTSSVSPDDQAILAGIAQRLRAHRKTERFGVRLIRNPLGLKENEVLLETCDLAHRTLHCSVAERDRVRPGTTVETSWQWEPSLSNTGPKVKQFCTALCQSDGYEGHYTAGHSSS